jgi:prepilin signal peptidase PulO-like enzyme (type II secretory pathway)
MGLQIMKKYFLIIMATVLLSFLSIYFMTKLHSNFVPILAQATLLGLIGAQISVFMGPIVDLMPISSGWLDNEEDVPENSFWHLIKNKEVKSKLLLFIPFLGVIKNKEICDIREYLFAQILMFFLFFIGGLKYSDPSELIFLGSFLILSIMSVLVSWIDLRVHWLPDRFLVPVLLLGLSCSPYQDIANLRIIGLIFLLLVVFTPMLCSSIIRGSNNISGGDLMFLALVGAWLGFNLQVLFMFLVLLIFFSILFGLGLFIKSNTSKEIYNFYFPLGPAIAVSFILTLISQ